MDNGARWKIMASNGSESLNNAFKTVRSYQLLQLLRRCSTSVSTGLLKEESVRWNANCMVSFFSTRVHEKMNKHIGKTSKMSAITFDPKRVGGCSFLIQTSDA